MDPIASLVTFATSNLSYTDDNGNAQNAANNGLEVLSWVDNLKRSADLGVPRVVIGPIQRTAGGAQGQPWANIGASPNARTRWFHFVEVAIKTQLTGSSQVTVTGYNASIALIESLVSQVSKHAGDIDGAGNFILAEIDAGPKDRDSEPTHDFYDVVFILKLWRDRVD